MINSFKKQFSVPNGLLGRVAGIIMAMENKKLNKWTLSHLHIDGSDRILEVGYGSGKCIEYMLKANRTIKIDGLDVSKTMKAQAEHRLGNYVESGQVTLMLGDVEKVRLDEEKYDKVVTVNNYTIWSHPERGLQRLHQVMKIGGKIAITMQPREENASSIKTRMFANQIYKNLSDCGFSEINIFYKRIHPELAVCVTAVKKG
ncbi:class I SAM-dependent methyltransferase [Metabacillus litoralis]|uniref:class I SAM-dependent methyltransferase n=1 Tax=Metabacillus litoralis TaxID=152268 RepID=UPI000EF5FD55|nr:class I SAM-dependent methyltransferase [Metabacillus litoralis]MCM3164815.1 class I SAM-dependent methyltransferase [Metabacillus litoralis]MCM3412877.1 class I SAM-dependent methyltransferase [Metabacillus litoralis]